MCFDYHGYVQQQADMLNGNINRLCVTDDTDEMQKMVFWACKRIVDIYEMRRSQIVKKACMEDPNNEDNFR